MPLTKTFRPARLHRLRTRAGLSQADVASQLRQRHGIKADQSQVANWERGSYTPRATTIPALADVLDCAMDELYGDDDDEESSPMVFERAARVIAETGDYALAAELQREVQKFRRTEAAA